MATGGYSDIDKWTDETFDFLCTVCKGKNKNTEAEMFCADCQDYFCSVCVKSHSEVPILKTHKVLDKAQFQPGSSVRFPAVPTERCKVHGHKPVDMYCRGHDVVGCATCMVVQHSECKDKHYVPEYVKNNTKACDPKDTATKLDAIASSLKEIQNAFNKEKENLKRCKENSLKEIRKFRTEINKRLDELEQETVKEMEQRLQSLTSKLEAGLKELQNTTTAVASAKDSLKSSGGNLSQMFVSIKMADTAVCHARDDLSKTGKQVSSTEMSFVANQKLQSLLNELQVLGSISFTESLKSKPQNQSSLPQVHNIQTNIKSHESQSSSSLMKIKASSSLMKIKGSRKCKVKVKSDSETCSILGACTLEDGTIILSDNNNKKLKRLHSSTLTVTDTCDVPEWPYQVCAITNQEVAVGCSLKQLIQFVSASKSMNKTRKINTGFNCYGITYADGKLFVSDLYESVYVYKVSGERLMCYREGPSGQKLFSEAASLAVSTDTSKIYVADNNKGLIILDYNGHLVGQYNGRELRGAYSVCLLMNGSVLVCGQNSMNVLQFSANGELLGEVLKSDGSCQTVCCNKNNSKLIVGCWVKDEIEVYDVSGE